MPLRRISLTLIVGVELGHRSLTLGAEGSRTFSGSRAVTGSGAALRQIFFQLTATPVEQPAI